MTAEIGATYPWRATQLLQTPSLTLQHLAEGLKSLLEEAANTDRAPKLISKFSPLALTDLFKHCRPA